MVSATVTQNTTNTRPPVSQSRRIAGWVSVSIATLVTSFLGFWGILENFHEGWHHPTIELRIAFTFAYLSFMFAFILMSLVSVRCPWLGGMLYFGAALFAVWFFSASPASVTLIAVPATILGLGYLWGRPQPRKWAYWAITVVPLVTVFAFGVGPAIRVATRIDDGGRGARHLDENGVDLIWAPQGPGWPTQGMSWYDAVERCRYLNEDGTSISKTPQNVWRLPTVEEAVRSQCRHGQNCAGTWDAAKGKAVYARRPDKETPLWDIYSQVIYWWTATDAGNREAYMIAYDGQVWRRPKTAPWGYLGFRAVKSPSSVGSTSSGSGPIRETDKGSPTPSSN